MPTTNTEGDNIGRVQRILHQIDAQITEDFGDSGLYASFSENREEINESEHSGQGIQDGTIPCITGEEYPWAIETVRDIESGGR